MSFPSFRTKAATIISPNDHLRMVKSVTLTKTESFKLAEPLPEWPSR